MEKALGSALHLQGSNEGDRRLHPTLIRALGVERGTSSLRLEEKEAGPSREPWAAATVPQAGPPLPLDVCSSAHNES